MLDMVDEKQNKPPKTHASWLESRSAADETSDSETLAYFFMSLLNNFQSTGKMSEKVVLSERFLS